MDKEGIRGLLKELKGPNVSIEERGEWLSSHCLFARWLHPNQSDRNMSFGIKQNLYDESVYNCFTCKSKGTLPQLLDKLERYTGEDYRVLKGEIEDGEFLGSNLPEWGNRFIYDSNTAVLGDPVDNDYLDIYDDAEGHAYIESRGIDKSTAKALDLRIDPDNHGVERILFPVYSHTGYFYGYTGRATTDNIEPKVRDYFGLPKRLLLLGSEFINPTIDEYVVLVEGLFDYAIGFSFGEPVIASMHSGLTPQQASILKDINLPVYVMYDDDTAGHLGVCIVADILRDHVPVMKMRYPKQNTVVDKDTGKKRPPSDPGELNNSQFLGMLEDARLA